MVANNDTNLMETEREAATSREDIEHPKRLRNGQEASVVGGGGRSGSWPGTFA